MTTPTPQDAAAMPTALVELPHPASTTPPTQPPRPRSSSPGLRCPSNTTPTTRRCTSAPTPAAPRRADRRPTHRAGRTRRRRPRLARRPPHTHIQLLPEGSLVMTGTGLSDTIDAELGVDEIYVLMSRIRAIA